MAITIEIYSIEEENIKTAIIKNQVEIQEIITKSISKNIDSELRSIIFELNILAESMNYKMIWVLKNQIN